MDWKNACIVRRSLGIAPEAGRWEDKSKPILYAHFLDIQDTNRLEASDTGKIRRRIPRSQPAMVLRLI